MSKELENKVALITGGTSGIGRDTAVLFAKEGAKVIFSGRREVEGAETLNLIRAEGGDGHFIRSDASKSTDMESLVQGASRSTVALTSPSTMWELRASGLRSSSKPRKIGTGFKTLISRACGSA